MNRFAMMAKLTAGIGLLLGLIAFMANLYLPTVLEQSEKRALARKAASNAAVAAYNMAPALLLGDTLAAKTSLLGFEQDEDLEYIVVGDSSERVFFTFRGASAGEVPVTLWGSGDNALGGTETYRSWHSVAQNGRVIGSVMVGLSLRPLNAEIARSRFLISTVSSGMFCLGFLIVLIISAITTRPLARFAKTAKRIASGDLSQRAEVLSHGGTGDLAQSFNTMIARVESAYERLRDSEEQHRDLLDNANDLVQRVSMDGRLLYVNAAWRQTMGYSDDDLRTLNILDVIHPESMEQWQRLQQRILQGESVETRSISVVTKSGEVVYLEGSSNCRFDHGKPVLTRSIFHNITWRKHAEQALRHRSAFELRIITASAEFLECGAADLDRVLLGTLESVGRFLRVDRSYVFLAGKDGTSFTNSHEWCARGIQGSPEPQDTLQTAGYPWLHERLRRHEHVYIPDVSSLPDEARAERKLLLGRFCRSTVLIPMLHGERVIGFLGFDSVRFPKQWVEEDIALLVLLGQILVSAIERTEAEVALRESERRYRDLFQNAPIGIYRMTVGGKVAMANPAILSMLGYASFEELAAINIAEAGFESPESRREFLRRLQEEKELTGFRSFWRRKDGSLMAVRENAKAVSESGEKISAIEGTVEDITESLRAEEEIRRRIEVENLVAAISQRFIKVSAKEMDSAMRESLSAMGRMVGADRAMLLFTSHAGLRARQVIEWHREGVPPSVELFSALRGRDVPWISSRLRRFESVRVDNPGALPPEAAAEKAVLESHRICGIVLVPMVFQETLIGVLSIGAAEAERGWSEGVASLLKLAGEIFMNTLERTQAETTSGTLYEIARALNCIKSLDESFIAVHQSLAKIIDARHFVVALEDQHGKGMTIQCDTGPAEGGVLTPLLAQVIHSGEPLYLHGKELHSLLGETPGASGAPLPSVWIGVPLTVNGSTIGALSLQHPADPHRFSPRDLGPLQVVADQLAIAISRRWAEERIVSSLEEKEMLLKEVHHRVKNNMQVISSLLSLQAATIEDEAMREAFSESENRIRSMALIHDKLYRSNDLVAVDFAEYLNDMGKVLLRAHSIAGGITLHVDADDAKFGIDVAVPCGLIVNELITNAMKHAFAGGREGNLYLSIKSLDGIGRHRLTVRDDGSGLPAGFCPETSPTLGMSIVTSLVRQLDGTLRLEGGEGHGLTVEIDFTLPSIAAEHEHGSGV